MYKEKVHLSNINKDVMQVPRKLGIDDSDSHDSDLLMQDQQKQMFQIDDSKND